jgi:hypothetical protein
MSIPSIKMKVHNQTTYKKMSEGLKKFYADGSPMALQQIERIRKLNPTADPDVRLKISQTLKNMRWKPIKQGGNGTPLPIPQSKLLKLLGKMWYSEYAVPLGKRKIGYPTCYKIDIAYPEKMIGIEVDGYSHCSRKELDKKKTQKLNSLGWKILRFSNKEIMESEQEVLKKIYSMIYK